MVKKREYWAALSAVTTVKEVAECWQISEHKVRYYLLYGDLVATKICGTWVIALGSVIDLWGQPKVLPDDVSDLRKLVDLAS